MTAAPTVSSTELLIPTSEAMRELGHQLAALLRPGDLVVLSGDLGAGKTTLTQGIGTGLAVRGDITSPTFVIARLHPPTIAGPALVHVDAYRLGSLAEVDDLDLDAALEEVVTVVEWGQGLVEGLAEARLEVSLRRPRGDDPRDDAQVLDHEELGGDQPRHVVVTGVGIRWAGVQLPGA
jgi:tRNA threonylcarbamoyladenosine biosynthesis protein TsaE